MFRATLILGIGLACCSSRATGQTVQLPTFNYFTVSTTVLVPDRGSAFLGGVKRARYGSTSTGVPGLSGIPGVNRLFKNRAIGSDISASGAHATATIMDLGEMDEAILADAAARRGAAPADAAIARKAAFLSKHVARNNRSAEAPAIRPQR